MVTKKLLEDILSRYAFPQMIGLDDGPAFVFKVSKDLATVLGIDWKLHSASRTLKETLTRLTLETGGDWVSFLPFPLCWCAVPLIRWD